MIRSGGPRITAMRSLRVGLVALVLAGCSPKPDNYSVVHACNLVHYWADRTATVSNPDTGPPSPSEIAELAQKGWPNNAAVAAQLARLYNDWRANVSTKQYTTEASAFTTTYCNPQY